MSQFRQLYEGDIEAQPEAGGQIVWTVTDGMLVELGWMETQEMLEDDVAKLLLVNRHWS